MPIEQQVCRRIPSTQEDLDTIVAIAGHTRPGYKIIKKHSLVPVGAMLTVDPDASPSGVAATLRRAGYTAHHHGLIITVTGVISRLEMLRAERDRLDDEIAAEEERARTHV